LEIIAHGGQVANGNPLCDRRTERRDHEQIFIYFTTINGMSDRN
jgi:hypothetical protein